MDVSVEFNFLHTKLHIINAVKWVVSLAEYTKVDVSWGIGGTYSAPPSSLAGFKGAASQQDGNGGEDYNSEGKERTSGEEGQRGRRRKWCSRSQGRGNSTLVVGPVGGRDKCPWSYLNQVGIMMCFAHWCMLIKWSSQALIYTTSETIPQKRTNHKFLSTFFVNLYILVGALMVFLSAGDRS